MGKGKELTEDERSFIVGMKRGGASITAIAKETERPRGTIATILRKFRCSGKVRTLKRSGRSSLTTEREDRCLTRLLKENRRSSAKTLAKIWSASISKTVSERTTRRRLKSSGYSGRQARKKPFISTKNQKKEYSGLKRWLKKQ